MMNSFPTGLQPAPCYTYQPKTGRLLLRSTPLSRGRVQSPSNKAGRGGRTVLGMLKSNKLKQNVIQICYLEVTKAAT
jgi:hypothetical protein